MSVLTPDQASPELSRDATLRELPTEHGVLRYHEAGDADAPPLLMLHGSGPGVTDHWAMIEQKSAWEAVVLAFLTRED